MGAGALGLGGLLGKDDGGTQTPKATKWQQQIAMDLYQDSDPIRQGLFSNSANFLGGGMDVRNTQAGLAYKNMADQAFGRARDNTMGRYATGGPLLAALTNLESNRAGALTQGYGQLYDAELGRAMQLGTGMSAQSLGGLGQAGSVQAQIAQANAAQSAAGKGALGAAAGGYLGSK